MMKEDYIRFLKNVDKDFPIPLSKKIKIDEYAEKLISTANVIVEKDNGKIIGIVAGYIDNSIEEISYISIVAVQKEYRGKSIAKKLLQKYIDECKEKNLKGVHLYTHKTNITALTMYKNFGFISKENVKEERTEDVHLFLYF